jgi:glycerol-3-phosphate dehydrogenase (NAD(P)+)
VTEKATVLGAGSWGTALATLLARNGVPVRLWDRDAVHVANLERERLNQRYLPDIELPENITPLSDMATALETTDFVVVVVPSAGFREVLKKVKSLTGADLNLVWATKGLEPGSGNFLHEIVNQELPGHPSVAVLSGPSFAREVALGLPTAVTVASQDQDYADRVASLFHCARFRTYTCNDVIGVELGNSVKNVLAIAAGISDGLGYGANARAALITRGLAEIMRLGSRLGGHRQTFIGLAGLGDLVLTCTDDQSRNRRLGLALGRGIDRDKAVREIGQAVEGLHTAREIAQLAARFDVEMPISEHVKHVLFDGMRAHEAVDELLAREPKPETL